jgi:ADP-ribose pyrophosphatase YjhB (NUDIX family)
MNHAARNTPKVTVDIIIEILDWKENRKAFERPGVFMPGIVLIERKNDPQGIALPGGFVDIGERAIDAAVREAFEETTLRVTNIKQFHTYTSPGRDPRGHGVTIVYIAQAIGLPFGEDDAKKAFIADPLSLDDWLVKQLCFDHAQIITDYINYRQNGERPTTE